MDQTPSKKPSIENKTLEIEYSDNQEHSGCVDFISNMPDDILCRIISKLPTKYAIGTSILSIRWKHLFSLIPETFLDFDDSLLLHPTASPPSGLTVPSKERKTCFVNFMYRVMDVILKDVPTAFKFRLKLNQYYEDYQIIDWVLAALVHGVMWFELVFSLDHASSLFDCLSGWTSVHHLKLENSIIHAYGSFSLPNLKKLVINDSVCADEDSLPHLLYGSPVLEDLTMHYCYLGELETLNISIPTLRFLIIEYCYNEAVPYELVLDTPKLDLLFYQDNVAKGYTVKNLSTLVNAQIYFGEFDHLWEGDISKYDQNVADLITGCSSVDSLCISKASLSVSNLIVGGFVSLDHLLTCDYNNSRLKKMDFLTILILFLQFFYNSGREWPMFCNLKLLQLFGFDTDGWELLPKIIESAPNLESLDMTEVY